MSQPVCEDQIFQDGGSLLTSRSPTVTGLDGENEPKGCVPSDLHPLRSPTPPHLLLRGEDLIWPIISTQNVNKAVEASNGTAETEWLSPNNIPRRHTQGQT